MFEPLKGTLMMGSGRTVYIFVFIHTNDNLMVYSHRNLMTISFVIILLLCAMDILFIELLISVD